MKTQTPDPLTGIEIINIIRDHWVAAGLDWNDARDRGELGFAYMLDARTIREWGFTREGETLYEPCSQISVTIVKGFD